TEMIPSQADLSGKEIRSYIINKVTTEITSKAKNRPAGTSAKDLKATVTNLKESAKALRHTFSNGVNVKLQPMVDRIQKTLRSYHPGSKANIKLSKADEEFLHLFYDTTVSERDEYLEEYGIPRYERSVYIGE